MNNQVEVKNFEDAANRLLEHGYVPSGHEMAAVANMLKVFTDGMLIIRSISINEHGKIVAAVGAEADLETFASAADFAAKIEPQLREMLEQRINRAKLNAIFISGYMAIILTLILMLDFMIAEHFHNKGALIVGGGLTFAALSASLFANYMRRYNLTSRDEYSQRKDNVETEAKNIAQLVNEIGRLNNELKSADARDQQKIKAQIDIAVDLLRKILAEQVPPVAEYSVPEHSEPYLRVPWGNEQKAAKPPFESTIETSPQMRIDAGIVPENSRVRVAVIPEEFGEDADADAIAAAQPRPARRMQT